MINLLIKSLKKDKKLILTKGKGSLTIPLGLSRNPDKSKQTTFKEWNRKYESKK